MNKWRVFIFSVALISFFTILFLPQPQDLSIAGKRALAIFVLCLIFWVTNVIPLSVTGLLAIVLLPLLNVLNTKTAFSLFGNEAVFFILGAFIIAVALMKTGLSTRLSLFFLNKFKKTPQRLLIGIIFSSAFLSFWMPEHAVAALMFPIVLEIAESLRLKPGFSSYGKSLFLSLAWGAVIGGVATLLGGARNPLAIGMLYDRFKIKIGFLEWMIAIVPVVIVMLVFAYFTIRIFFKIDIKSIHPAERVLAKKIKTLGPLSREEKIVGVILVITIICWITLSNKIGLANISIFSAISLFIFNVIHWKEVEEYVNWGVILMYGGAIALGFALAQTQAAEWLANIFVSKNKLSPFLFIVTLSLIAKLLTEGISNTAAVAILLPLGFAFGHKINPVIIVYIVAVPAGLAFCLPMGTPPNAICYSAGYYRISDAGKAGLLLNLVSWIIFLLMIKFYWPIIGLIF
ncbi:DASS family sodium-coupled anion symporter [Candidatus Aminicenantes bacterium AC-335-A11]|jgi:sodium-dependent dicarboxylate transporter 2/3/5|nr:DASS family sodium-coupled anion symporter [SCandidatus Aminicenantes bacterium Aminicenantia_JdfR_composite]MCP2597317.1 DASS family sodium-coupled anion symporter [Candidatus Aminicenantes bacterium AC-335-G13]MCP2598439.1 DASS family sodium-coupled anion symporter [Candidatus Aminicenantes bacterium AC-335-L06]MCP2605700.1 DASS family sodium-coupled anion symporter [Candidatus Aminicenantes bacterium AC-335-O07]MCP2618721.1 DASS family sodium-coupled anion symporter [Candidatus Aminicenan